MLSRRDTRYRPNDGFEYRWDGGVWIERYRVIHAGTTVIVATPRDDTLIHTYDAVTSAETLARVVDAWLAGRQEARAELRS